MISIGSASESSAVVLHDNVVQSIHDLFMRQVEGLFCDAHHPFVDMTLRRLADRVGQSQHLGYPTCHGGMLASLGRCTFSASAYRIEVLEGRIERSRQGVWFWAVVEE